MTKSPNRLLATVFGAVYLLVGLLGFTVTGGIGFFDQSNPNLLVGLFQVNIFHNVAHLLIGAALLIAGLSNIPAARTVNTVIGAAYLLLGLVGLWLVTSQVNILAINGADNILHFASAALLLAVGVGAERGVRSSTV